MEAVRADPLFYIRHHIKQNSEHGIYDAPLPANVGWAACWLDDLAVPGTKVFRELQKALDEDVNAEKYKINVKKYKGGKGAKK